MAPTVAASSPVLTALTPDPSAYVLSPEQRMLHESPAEFARHAIAARRAKRQATEPTSPRLDELHALAEFKQKAATVNPTEAAFKARAEALGLVGTPTQAPEAQGCPTLEEPHEPQWKESQRTEAPAGTADVRNSSAAAGLIQDLSYLSPKEPPLAAPTSSQATMPPTSTAPGLAPAAAPDSEGVLAPLQLLEMELESESGSSCFDDLPPPSSEAHVALAVAEGFRQLRESRQRIPAGRGCKPL